MPKKKIYCDFCVIGAGSGGLSFAAGAVQMGASVVLLEADKMGGDCLNYGCVPSKAIIAASKIGYKAKKSDEFGWFIDIAKLDYKKVHNHIHDVIKEIAPHDSVERFEKLGVTVIKEAGRFTSPKRVETKSHIVKAKRYIIATGSKAFIPPIKGLDSAPYLTNETIFELKTLPKHLVIIGGGPIGIEMAQAYRRLGSEVTILEAFTALPKDDQELTSRLKDILVKERISINERVNIVSVEKYRTGVKITYKNINEVKHVITASHLLVSAGRRPNVKSLGLDSAKIGYTDRGINVNKKLKTTNHRVFAIGDITGGYQFTHVAGYHAGLAIRNGIFGLGLQVSTKAIPWVTYTDPELAHVGYTEKDLQDRNIKYQMHKLDFTENDRAIAEKRTEGMIKLLVSPRGYILGCSILGLNAGEMIYPWVIAIQNDLKLSAITNSIAPYPTLNDISKRVAGNYYKDKIFSPLMKSIVRFLMRITL